MPSIQVHGSSAIGVAQVKARVINGDLVNNIAAQCQKPLCKTSRQNRCYAHCGNSINMKTGNQRPETARSSMYMADDVLLC